MRGRCGQRIASGAASRWSQNEEPDFPAQSAGKRNDVRVLPEASHKNNRQLEVLNGARLGINRLEHQNVDADA